MIVFLGFWAVQLFVFSFLSPLSCLGAYGLSFASACIWFFFYRILSRFRFGIYLAFFVWEFTKDRLLGGLAWGDLYSFVAGMFPLNQVFRWLHPYLVSLLFLAVLLNTAKGLVQRDKRALLFALALSLSWLCAGYITFLYSRYELEKDGGKTSIKVCVFQTAIKALDKQRIEKAPELWQGYIEFLESKAVPMDLLVFPETMALYTWPSAELINYVQSIQSLLSVKYLLVGTNLYSSGRFYNSAVLLRPDGMSTYSKQKLVPFGEYVPSWLPNWAERKLIQIIPLLANAQYEPGKEDVVFEMDGFKFVPLICYEDSFYYLIAQRLKGKGKIDGLIVLSNDDWFGKGLGQWFHLNLARMMAIRFGVWVIKANNDGFSCVIDPLGRVSSGDLSWNNLGKRALVCGIIRD